MPDLKQQHQDEYILSKEAFPTGLSSEDIRAFWTKELREQAFFSARTTSKEYLEKIQELLADYQNAVGKTADGEPISQGLGRTRMLMREKLDSMGLLERDEQGNVIDDQMTKLGSTIRLNLIVKTNTQLAKSAQQKVQSQDPLQKILRPYFELVRNESRKTHRNWWDRWLTCANKIGWKGVVKGTTRMIAKTDSPIWAELGNGFADSLGTDRPPFAFGSGMGWKTVTAKEVESLGLEVG